MKFWLVDLTEFQNSKAICPAFLMEWSELEHNGGNLFASFKMTR